MCEHNKYLQPAYDIIRRYASKEKPICATEIRKRILQIYEGDKCERKTIERALENLRESFGKNENGEWINEDIKLHYDVINRKTSPICKNYWLEITSEDELSDKELMYLIDAVQYSRHISNEFADTLIRKLKIISNAAVESKFGNFRTAGSDFPTVNPEFFNNIGKINEAITNKKLITFVECEYGIDKKLHPKNGGSLTVDPACIVVANGNYYLLCTKSSSAAIKSYRIDKMKNVTVSDEDSPDDGQARKAIKNPGDYIFEHRNMNNGTVVEVTILADENILDDIIDYFGNKVRIDNYGKYGERIVIRVKSGERGIIDWAIQYGGSAEIISPLYLRSEIERRIRGLNYAYSDSSSAEIDYREAIRNAEAGRSLCLIDIDLNRFDTYRTMTKMHRLNMQRNHISDFSFLEDFRRLRDLHIAHNYISDPEVLSGLHSLHTLELDNTGITDLEFLRGLSNLKILTLHEYTLEDVEAIYSLPDLKALAVNRMTAELIDKKKLMRVYGKDFKYKVDDSSRAWSVMGIREDLPSEQRMDFEEIGRSLSGYSTFMVTDRAFKELLCENIYTGGRRLGGRREKIFSIVEGSGSNSEKVKLYENTKQFADEKYTWYVTYKGGQPASVSDVDIKSVCQISIFKKERGLKLIVTVSKARMLYKDRSESHEAMMDDMNSRIAHIRYLMDNRVGWAEVSGNLESQFRNACSIDDVVSPNELLSKKVYRMLEIDEDDYHFICLDEDGLHSVRKIVYGHIAD